MFSNLTGFFTTSVVGRRAACLILNYCPFIFTSKIYNKCCLVENIYCYFFGSILMNY